jgi:hypothetical protein
MTNSSLEEYLSSEPAHNWDQVNDFYERVPQKAGQWIFRGQGNSDGGLKSSLERQLETLGIDPSTAYNVENGLLRRFKRQCHHYGSPGIPVKTEHPLEVSLIFPMV